jgi:uncharacterized membrane protein
MAFWNTLGSGMGPRSRPPITRRRPIRRPSPEPLEERCLLATTYSITDIGATVDIDKSDGGPDYWVAINNASPAQVVVGQGPDGKAFIWDSVHGSKDLGTVNNEVNSESIGINDSGQVVGISWTTTVKYPKNPFEQPIFKTVENGFLWSASGGMSDLGKNVNGDAINNSGEIMDFFDSLWDGQKWISLGNLPGGTHSYALGLNNDGQVVGDTLSGDQTFEEGYLWSPSKPNGAKGTMTGLGYFDTTSPGSSHPKAINGQGWVTGSAENDDLNGGAAHAFIWEPSAPNATTGKMVDLGTLANNPSPGYTASEGEAINSSRVVVGYSSPAGASLGQTDAVIWQPGAGGTYTLSDLNSLIPRGTGWTLGEASAINDNGLIVAFGSQNGGPTHVLLLTPQTSPAAGVPKAAATTSALASGSNRPTNAAPAASVWISPISPGGPGVGGQYRPAPTADPADAPPAYLTIFDFALADLAARTRPKSLRNDGVMSPRWPDPGIS